MEGEGGDGDGWRVCDRPDATAVECVMSKEARVRSRGSVGAEARARLAVVGCRMSDVAKVGMEGGRVEASSIASRSAWSVRWTAWRRVEDGGVRRAGRRRVRKMAKCGD